jgi:hypothetical protein
MHDCVVCVLVQCHENEGITMTTNEHDDDEHKCVESKKEHHERLRVKVMTCLVR